MALSDAALRQLCVRAREGSASARDQLLQAHWGLVVHVAAYFHRPGAFLELGDLIQQGGLGILHAMEKFDAQKNSRGKLVRFSTYAYYWVTHYIRREIENHGRTVSVPIRRLRRMKRKDVWTEDQAGAAILEIPDPQDTPDSWCRQWDHRLQVERLLQNFSSRTQDIFRLRYGLDESGEMKTQQEVGKRLGISSARVGVQERMALYEMRRVETQPTA
jgi:RNA polymerase sporulation-specific sigma factor